MTGVFRRNPVGEREELSKEYIDYWCGQCQFPIGPACFFDKVLLQECWDNAEPNANKWHVQHECPFAHKGAKCRCNDFRSMGEAFRAAGLEYKETGGR